MPTGVTVGPLVRVFWTATISDVLPCFVSTNIGNDVLISFLSRSAALRVAHFATTGSDGELSDSREADFLCRIEFSSLRSLSEMQFLSIITGEDNRLFGRNQDGSHLSGSRKSPGLLLYRRRWPSWHDARLPPRAGLPEDRSPARGIRSGVIPRSVDIGRLPVEATSFAAD